MTRLCVLWALLSLLLGAPAAVAQEEPETGAPAAAGTDTPLLHGKLGLSLKDAIAMGVENNLNVEVERHEPYIAEQRASGTWGAYDPDLFAEFDYSDIDTPSATGLVGLVMGLFLFAVMAMAGKTGAEFFIPALFLLAGGGALASNFLRLPRWAEERERQMEHIAGRARALLEAPPPKDDPETL